MRLNIIDPITLELKDVVTNYESVQWVSTFNTLDGTFQINCSVDYINKFKLDDYIENTEELEHIGVIKKIQVVSSNEKDSLQVNGIMLEKDIFSRRVMRAWVVYQDVYLTFALDALISGCLTEPAEPLRKDVVIGQVIIPKDADIPDLEKTEYSANYPNLIDEVINILQSVNLGVKARLNRTTNKVDIEFYTGTDHTHGSDEPVVFSPERGTVLETTYAKDSSQNITDIVLIGEDNLTLHATRERKEGEPLIEKSLDVSSECPWPTYQVEQTDDNGSYYRYKKFNPPADFITNRDVWERYAVDRIETTETRYREVINEVQVPVDLEALIRDRAEIRPSVDYGSVAGAICGTPSNIGAIINAANRGDSSPRFIGFVPNGGFKTKSLLRSASAEENAVFVDDPNAAKPPDLYAKYRRSTKAKMKAITKQPKMSNGNRGLGATIKPSVGLPNRVVGDQLMANGLGDNLYVTQQEVTMEPYEVTIVTYETKDFLEYVYVNIGDPPSLATKIIQGSVESKDVMYYENFEDVRVTEAKYRDTLFKKAQSYLKTFVVSENVDVKPYYLSNINYGEDYSLGDIVTARNSKLGYTVDLRVTQVTKTWDSKGYTIDIGLGDTVPSLTNRIKLIAKGGA